VVKTMIMQQHTLDARMKPNATFARFHPGENASLVSMLQALHAGDLCLLVGDQGSGKSHLLHALAHHNQPKTSFYCPLKNIAPHSATIITDVCEHHDLLLFDDIDTLNNNMAWQQALVQVINQARHLNKIIVFSSQTLPNTQPTLLKDLLSRITSGLVLCLKPFDDTELATMLHKLTEKLGLSINKRNQNYLLTHGPRQIGALQRLLYQLDKRSLTDKKPISLSLIKQALSTMENDPSY
jgi:DnaA-homolog protein